MMTEEQIEKELVAAIQGDKPPIRLIARALFNLERIADSLEAIVRLTAETYCLHQADRATFRAKDAENS